MIFSLSILNLYNLYSNLNLNIFMRLNENVGLLAYILQVLFGLINHCKYKHIWRSMQTLYISKKYKIFFGNHAFVIPLY